MTLTFPKQNNLDEFQTMASSEEITSHDLVTGLRWYIITY